MQRRGIILYNISIHHVYKEKGHGPIIGYSAKSMPGQRHKHRPRIAGVSLTSQHKTSAQMLYKCLAYAEYTALDIFQRAKDDQQAPFKSWPSIHDIWPTQKRHPLNGSCSPVRCDISALTQQTRGADPTLR